MKCAFPNEAVPPPELEVVMKDIINKCDGLPLALEVLGKYLKRKRDYEEWEQTLNVLKRAEKISNKEQQIFLDATIFFCNSAKHKRLNFGERNEWTLSKAKAAWRAVYEVNEQQLWQNLVDRSLVYCVGEDDTVKVHEQLQGLGQKIASEPSNVGKCRVWDGEVGSKMLCTTTEDLDGKGYHALRVGNGRFFERINIPEAALSNFKKVKFLDVDNRVTIAGPKDGELVPTEVVLLKCHGPDLFDPAVQTRLAVLELSWMWRDLPPSIGQLSGLKHLTIDNFFGRTLPASFGELTALQHLTLTRAGKLESLPESFGQLSNLNYLRFKSCNSLNTLPDSFAQLNALHRLSFLHCQGLESLPNSFGKLSALNHLEFICCKQLHTLPESFGELKTLHHLELSDCTELQSLPNSFGELNALNSLKLCPDSELHTLPESFGDLSTLTELDLKCKYLLNLPESFGQLTNLQRLEIYADTERRADSLGDLKGLRDLNIGYYSATSIPNSIINLPLLHRFCLSFEGDLVEPLPPWLITPNVPSNILTGSKVVFQVQDGCFSLIESQSSFALLTGYLAGRHGH
ncbi:unnamed protein product [Calypogeia fissa]